MTAERTRTRIFWAFAAIYLIWGSTYLGIQVGIETIPPFLLGATRFLVAGGALVLWARLRGEPFPAASVWRAATILGGLFFLFGNGLVVWAEQHVPSGRTALLASTSPIWTVMLESALDGWRRPPARVMAGIGLGMAGLFLLAAPAAGSESVAVSGILALLGASIAWATGSVYSHRHHLPASPTMATGMKMLAGGGLLAIVALVTGEGGRLHLAAVSPASWFALIYLCIFGSIIGFSAFTYLLRTTTPQLVGTSAYVNPLVAVFLGWALASEAVTSRMMVGALVSLSGVVLIRWGSREPPAPEEADVGTIETGDFPVPNPQ